MKYTEKVHEAVFLKRYKRFFADVQMGKDVVVAHVANTGSLKTAVEAGAPCLVTETDNPERKLKFTLQAVKMGSNWVGVNTSWPNKLAKEAFENKVFKHWKGFTDLKSEVKINKESRLDLALSKKGTDRLHYVEIKNVTLAFGDTKKKKGTAQFPDGVTERGQKHLKELMKLVDQGHTAEILFTVQRSDCEGFSPADEIDPEYGKLLRQAQKKGVLITAALVEVSDKKIELTGELLKVSLP